MKSFDIIFITTCINKKYINRLLTSISNNNQQIKCLVVVTLQNDISVDVTPYLSDNTRIETIEIDEQENSSKGRNIGIGYVLDKGFECRHIMFPDDDSSFDSSFFELYSISTNENTSYVVPTYCENTKIYYNKAFSKLKPQQILGEKFVLNIGTWSYILAFDAFKKVKTFDENMGVGAKYGAGEDGDYYLRCLRVGPMVYIQSLYTYHPAPATTYKDMSFQQLLNRYKKYGEGVVYMLVKNKLYGMALRCAFNGMAGSIVALFSLKPKLSVVRAYAFIIRLRTFFRLTIKGAI